MSLQSLVYSRGSLKVLDQLKVPQSKEYLDVRDAEAAWQVVKKMQVRGAPLIAIVSALGLAVEAEARRKGEVGSGAKVTAAWLKERMDYLRTSRPTAVNLFNAMDELTSVATDAAVVSGASGDSVYEAYISAAEAMLEEDVRANKAIGEHGADAVLAAMERAGCGDRGARVLTICNTGALATAGWGTALGVIRSLHGRGKLERAFALETRPYNQGSRLTAFELVEDKIPGTLICDSMAAALMLRKGIDACVVGADRVAANGDSANKIGTYALSIIAKHHGVPFFVAAPTTTLDARTASGADITIEERPPEELCCIDLAGGERRRIAADGIDCWNPAFDVAPVALIAGIITERRVLEKTPGEDAFDVPGLLREAAAERDAKRRRVA
mmetsp:Transcript_39633/g.127036  ORF Transcript_39633/g.127036 Transcript_39633/m.127036 type:complete len:385 (-) Transcript_39633:14-1168(-)